ncbi:MAG: hypothetical protein ACP6IP_08345 [Candidatus Njordarchaeia archaeon]
MSTHPSKIDQTILEAIDKVNAIKRTPLGMDEVGVELLRTISMLLNALKRYNKGIADESRGELKYALELIQGALDGLKGSIRHLEKKL